MSPSAGSPSGCGRTWTVWSFELEPTEAGGTRLVQRREAPKGISDLSVRAPEKVMGGVAAFTEEMQLGMEQTLSRIRTEVEAGAPEVPLRP